ncbi:MAG: alpha/beta fold hydrolase [Anaerolineaceae bacterium]|nr:alpha/beta fold hydrolase [Anaerolineaceae bacterium]
MRGISVIWRVIILGALVLGMAGTAQPTSAAPILQSGDVPRFEPGPCMFEVPPGITEGEQVDCGWLVVPEEHANPNGPTIKLAVAILRSQVANPRPDPLVMAQGGPGGSTIDYYSQVLFYSGLWKNRDIILFDQRGTLYSEPNLVCSEVLDKTIELLNVNLEAEEAETQFREAILACHGRLEKDGINLSAYDSLENAADINALRQALGYEQINLYGVSYGTLLALHTMRDYPEVLRSVILDAVVPTNRNWNQLAPLTMDRAFTEFFTACKESEECNREYPFLEQTYTDLYARLEENPVTLNVRDPEGGKVYPALVDGDTLVGTLFQLLYSTELIPLLPKMLQDFEKGDYAFSEYVLSLITFDRTMSYGMYYSVVCAEDSDINLDEVDYSGIRPELGRDAHIGNESLIALCEGWNVPQLDDIVDIPVSSDLPVLILNGRFDPITPPDYGAEAAKTLPNSYSFTFPNTGHGAAISSECADEIILKFLNDPGERPNAACYKDVPPVDFVTDKDVVNLPVIAKILEGRVGTLVGLVLAGLAALILLSALVVYPLVLVIRWARSKEGRPTPFYGHLAPWVAMVVAGLMFLFMVVIAIAFFGMVMENDYIFLMGVPGGFRPLFLLPPLIIVLVMAMVVLAVLGWKGTYWNTWRKVYFSVLTLCAVGCAVWLVGSGSLTAIL